MLAYGLFLARLNADVNTQDHARAMCASTCRARFASSENSFHSSMSWTKTNMRGVRWVVEEVLSIVNGLELCLFTKTCHSGSAKRSAERFVPKDEEEHRLFERDPFIYFYEDYLRAIRWEDEEKVEASTTRRRRS